MTEIDRALTPFTNEHFAAFCLKMLGQPYWYGCCGYKATSSLLTRKSRQYPQYYGSNRTARYRKDIANKCVVCDCMGGVKGYAWTNGGEAMLNAIGADGDVQNQYGSHGCPDKGTNGMFSYAKSKGARRGTISTLPEAVGLALHKNGHVGYYVGNGYAVEWKGFAYGCVKMKVAGRGWTHWYELPFINYGSITTSQPITVETPTVPRNLLYKPGNMQHGDDVRELQTRLNALGYNCGAVDGILGRKTDTAIRAFQTAHSLEVDGIVGKKTRAALQSLAQQAGTQSMEA